MNRLIKKIYLASPLLVRKMLANMEAKRRNYFKRGDAYHLYYQQIDIAKSLKSYNKSEQFEKIKRLLKYIYTEIPYYMNLEEKLELTSIDELKKLPLLSKRVLIENIDLLVNNKVKLWQDKTSGSTGTPLTFYRDCQSMQYEYALYDKLYSYYAGRSNFRKIRISGVIVSPIDNRKPPFWIYINDFNQLQCSAYHITAKTFELYLEAFQKYNVTLGTGYAKSWLFLAQLMSTHGIKFSALRAIVTDSEGLSGQEKKIIEKAFECPVIQTYGLSEVGMIALECKNNHYHIFSDRAVVEIIDREGNSLEQGEQGEIVVTDVYSFNAPFIRYKTGDLASISESDCGCGWKTPYLSDLSGRIDDYIVTPAGKKIGRLSHIAKPAVGVLGMQIIQTAPDQIEIFVLPSNDFAEESMSEVVTTAKQYLGEEIKVNWSITEELEKNSSGKVQYVIRRID